MEKCFTFLPFVYTPHGIAPLQLFSIHNREITLSPQEAISALALAMMGIVAPTLLRTKLELGEGIAIYNRQKVIR